MRASPELKPGAAAPKIGGGGIEVVAGDQFRAQGPVDLQEGAQGHHFPFEIADVEALDILGLQAVGRVGLDVDLEHLVELVEQVDIGRPQVGLQGVEDVVQGNIQRLGLGPVDVEIELGAAGAEGGGQASQARIGRLPARMTSMVAFSSSASPRLPRSSTIIWKPPACPRPAMGGGTSTMTWASWMAE